MESASTGRVTERHHGRGGRHPDGFSLLEMMMVITVILIVASIATPIYMTCVVRAREAVLADHLFTLRALIDRFTLDNGRAPARLEELVEKVPKQPQSAADPEGGSALPAFQQKSQVSSQESRRVAQRGGAATKPKTSWVSS
jgi:prepilin-type N-terminal cleavage/methylation domain-containing protein